MDCSVECAEVYHVWTLLFLEGLFSNAFVPFLRFRLPVEPQSEWRRKERRSKSLMVLSR